MIPDIEQEILRTKVGPQWSRIGIRHHHGIDLPLSALHSQQSCGIGEFYDLIPLIDWCQQVGMDVIQLLPLNDSGDDPSPFFALSSLALNPLFISLHKLEGADPKKLKELRHFNLLPRISYHEVQSHKFLFLSLYFEQMGSTTIKSSSFESYVKENDWVETYALFKVLKDVMSKNHWQTWPHDLQLQYLKKEALDRLIQKYWKETRFYIFLQFLCYQQLTKVKTYAHSKGVLLKGDIPILVSPDSADVWEYTDEFDLTLLAGHPPDPFNTEGQAWGLPIFKWDVMKERHFDWWKKRLGLASHFYDLYRIDHVLGFFRIWAIPAGQPGKNGRWIPEHEARWLTQGKEILSILVDESPMLPIAEDLGLVPDSVKIALTELGICGTKVMRWEKRKENGEQFINPLHYNPISMTTVSTHDSETLAIWWNKHPSEAKVYAQYKGWDYTTHLTKGQRRELLWDSHHTSSFFHINLIGEYLALFPELIWENPHDERINIPGVISPNNWTYRIRPPIEEMIAHEAFAEEVRNLIQ